MPNEPSLGKRCVRPELASASFVELHRLLLQQPAIAEVLHGLRPGLHNKYI